jgi:GntR family histidine utilization transcriptional repressor
MDTDRLITNPTSKLALDGVGAPYQQIERAIRSKIQTGAWPPGYRIPPEEELAVSLGYRGLRSTRF